MKKFKVYAESVSYFVLEVDAESEEEAHKIAKNADGGDFAFDCDGEWEITDVVEVKA